MSEPIPMKDAEWLESLGARGPDRRNQACARCGSHEWPENPRGLSFDGVNVDGAFVAICCVTDAEVVQVNAHVAAVRSGAAPLRHEWGSFVIRGIDVTVRLAGRGRSARQRRANRRRLMQRLRRQDAGASR